MLLLLRLADDRIAERARVLRRRVLGRKPGAKKRPPTARSVPWAELGSGRVQVEFGRAGADEEIPDEGDLAEDIEDDVSQSRGGGQ